MLRTAGVSSLVLLCYYGIVYCFLEKILTICPSRCCYFLAGLVLLYMNWFQTRLPRHLTRAYTVRACIFSLRCHQGNLVFDCRSKCLDHERRLCDKLSLGHIWCKFVYIDMFCIWTLRFYLVQSQWTNMYLNTEPTRLGLRPGQLFRGWTRILVIFKKIFQFFIDFWL